MVSRGTVTYYDGLTDTGSLGQALRDLKAGTWAYRHYLCATFVS